MFFPLSFQLTVKPPLAQGVLEVISICYFSVVFESLFPPLYLDSQFHLRPSGYHELDLKRNAIFLPMISK